MRVCVFVCRARASFYFSIEQGLTDEHTEARNIAGWYVGCIDCQHSRRGREHLAVKHKDLGG